MTALTAAELATKISELRDRITEAEIAASYGKGDKQLTRQTIGALQTQLNRYLRDYREVTARNSGAVNPGTITASWNSI